MLYSFLINLIKKITRLSAMARSSRIEDRLIKSIVVVGETRSNDYCIGFVAWEKDSDATFVVTQSSFIDGKRDRLKICFFDKVDLPAWVERIEGRFCMLRTEHHRFCKRVQWAEDRINSLSEAIIFLPSSPSTLSSIHIPVTLESAESYHSCPTDFVDGSDNLFLVACPYTEKTFEGYNRLIAAPIFDLDERSLGMGIFDCRRGNGAEMKVCLWARGVMALINRLIPPPPPPKAKRKGAEDGSKDKKKRKK